MKEMDLREFDYDLPEERIAQYPVNKRDMSRLLIYKERRIAKDVFKNIADYIPPDSLLVFNNSMVIRARILFRKRTGAEIEILCLEPHPKYDYEITLRSREPVIWECIVGNLKKWKSGIISAPFLYKGNQHELTAERIRTRVETSIVKFSWNCSELNFSDVIEMCGHMPLPPYIKRPDEPEDSKRYQTVYSSVRGSVAAPTAGLHFTPEVFSRLNEKEIKIAELTLHVGAGTFQPVKSDSICDHIMHGEHFAISVEVIRMLLSNNGKIIPVGTTSVRTLESLYWLGVKINHDPGPCSREPELGQWEPYELPGEMPVKESMEAILDHMNINNISVLHASTRMIIIPGYIFRMTYGMITNFHQPRSTLLLLVAAWTGEKWKNIYKYALENEFRFLSYGDSSLLLK
jgi:S-adenosylmethionine:tRNA ribosyltransferase-isomerase